MMSGRVARTGACAHRRVCAPARVRIGTLHLLQTRSRLLPHHQLLPPGCTDATPSIGLRLSLSPVHGRESAFARAGLQVDCSSCELRLFATTNRNVCFCHKKIQLKKVFYFLFIEVN